MSDPENNKQIEELNRLLADLFSVDAFYLQGKRVVFSLTYLYEVEKSRQILEDRLKLGGYEYEIGPPGDTLTLTVSPQRKLHIPALNIMLFIGTVLTVYLVPVLYFNLNAPSWHETLANTLADLANGAGLQFTAALMSILLVHEMGHFIASRRRGIITSWPYFIPAPNFIGTFGAVIKSKSPFWNRGDLIEVGAAGPVAGWIVALIWLVYGLSHSTIAHGASITSGLAFSLQGESILLRALAPILAGPLGHGQFYLLSEAATAGWVGLLVTAINMLPIGQLDGGHVIYGLAPRRQAMLGWLGMGVLLILGFQSAMWWLFAALGFFMGVGHPPTLDDRRPVGRGARILGWAALVILLLSFTPVPFQ